MKVKYSQSIDQFYFYLIVILIGIGFVIQYSASSSLAAARFNDPGHYMRGHFIRIIAGLIVGLFFLKLNYNHLKSAAIWVIIAAILLLATTLIVHLIHDTSPTARWLHIGPLRFQPSELAKFAFILYLASFYDRHADNIGDFKRGFIPPALLLLLIVLLIIAEPDFSTAAVIIVLSVTLMFIGGVKILHLAPFAGLLGIIAAISVLLSPYKLKRILTAIGNVEDTQGAGYQIHQSLITLGNGGLWGRGLGGSIEKNLFLPEPHTDFVFSVTGEEFGFIGTTLLLILFLLLFIRGLRIAFRAPNVFGNLLGLGLSLSMFVYQLVNVGVVCDILPVTGLPLPFISYGGSTMLYNFACLGIILNISRYMINTQKPIRLVTVHV
jgi:cell division protein FtsW